MRRTKGKLSTDQIDALNTSRRDGGEELSEREVASAWYRYGVDITDVYDVIDILGQGHMGEVFTVRRKTTGHHTNITRHKQKESTEDLQRMKKRQDELDKKKELKSKKHFSPVISPVKGAFKKPLFKGTKKVIGKIEKKMGKEREASIDADADSNLAKFIGAADDPEIIPAPSKSPRGPLKPAIKKDAEAKYSDSPLPKEKSKVSGDNLVGDTATLTLLDTTPSDASVSSSGATDIAKKTKITVAVHFQRTFAVKTILTSRINKNQIQELVNEIMIMRKLDHPYVLKLYEVYHVKRKLWLVTELLSGGDLSARKLNEHGTKRVIEQVLRALAYLHRMGVLHRDIKLENILYENHSKNATVRLIDFGLSRTFDRTMVAADYTRTPYTMSPEMAREKKARMTDKTDVWAVGIIAFIMLSGEFPFIKSPSDLKNDYTMERLKHARFEYGITWSGRGITKEAKDFVQGCLQSDPNVRWTAKQALENLQNAWGPKVDKIWEDWQAKIKQNMKPEYAPPIDIESFEEEEEDDDETSQSSCQSSNSQMTEDDSESPISSFDNQARAENIKRHVQKVVQRKKAEAAGTAIQLEDGGATIDPNEVERYTNFGMLKKTVLMAMANTMDRGEVQKLRELFVKIDTNDSGSITLIELIDAFKEATPDVDENRVKALFKGVDRDKSGHIHYAEFLAALAESHGLVTLNRLQEAFDRIDHEGKGYIDHDDLKNILGADYDKDTVDEMIKEGDFKKNNQIDYEELLQLMFSDPVKGGELAGSIPLSPSDQRHSLRMLTPVPSNEETP